MSTLFSLQGRTAFITGGSTGIGAMIARGFLEHGATVVINGRNEERCAQTVTELSKFGEISACPGDISTLEGIEEIVETLTDKVDILVNNAGTSWGEPVGQFSEHGWDKVIDLNLKSVFFMTQQLMPVLIANGSPEQPAKVINISSIDGIWNCNNETPSYVASKAGLIQLTKHQAMKLTRKNVVVSGIAPGAFASKLNRVARDNPETIINHIPSKRIGTWEDMAGAAVFLASRAGDYVVGETVIVDGGLVHAGRMD